jgi:hypothetical protein
MNVPFSAATMGVSPVQSSDSRGSLDRIGSDVPTRPAIAPGELYTGSPFVLVDEGRRFTIGWQDWPASEGGPGFVTVRRAALGTVKVLERFSFDDDGWASAWRALVRLDRYCAERVLVVLAERGTRLQRTQRQWEEQKLLDAETLANLPQIIFLGGYAPEVELVVKATYGLRFLKDRLAVFSPNSLQQLATVLYRDIEDVEIGGPGVVKSGGGFTGGAVSTPGSVVGAVESRAIAVALNALTTRTKIKTVLRLQASATELFFLNTATEPEQLRIQLSSSLGAIRRSRQAAENSSSHHSPTVAISAVEELTRLASLLDSGLLTRNEFDVLKAQIIART